MIDFILHQSWIDRLIGAGKRRSIPRCRSSARGEKRLIGRNICDRHGPRRKRKKKKNAVQGVKEEVKSRPLIDR
jgi:hypothetical protein